MEKMSITRALSEKKLLAKRIQKHFEKFRPIAITVGGALPAGYKSVREFDEQARAAYDQIISELERYGKIVQAIAESNAVTRVTIAGEEYSVARALERKKFYENLGGECIDGLARYFMGKLQECKDIMESEKAREDREFDSFIGKDKGLKEEELKAARKIVADRHKVDFLDPLNLRAVLDEMANKRDNFLMNVDIVLTESNSRTEIEI